MWLKSLLRQGHGKGICHIICRSNLCYHHIFMNNYVSNEMILSLYVLSSLMIPWLLGLYNHSTIVTKQRDWNLIQSHNTNIINEFLKPNSFLNYFTSNNIFNFQGKVSNTRLLYTIPTNGSTVQGEYISWSGLFEINIRLEIRIYLISSYQTLAIVDKHIIIHSPKILEDMFYSLPMFWS